MALETPYGHRDYCINEARRGNLNSALAEAAAWGDEQPFVDALRQLAKHPTDANVAHAQQVDAELGKENRRRLLAERQARIDHLEREFEEVG